MTDLPYEKLLDSLFDGVYYVDAQKHITFWNKGAERITGYTKGEVMGSCCASNILRHIDDNGRELCIQGCPISDTLTNGTVHESEVFLHHKRGHRVPVAVRVTPVYDDQGNVIGAIEVFTDNSSSIDILNEMEELKKEAYQDPLTGVGNRRYGEMMLSTRLYELATHGTSFGILFFDIDHFKQFNDNYGHKTGDNVLVMVGKSISSTLRKWDVVSRWGGEEFVIILPDISSRLVNKIAERIRLLIEHSFIMVGEEKIKVTVSMGATMALTNDTSEKLIVRADSLMYQSKQAGRNRVTKDF